MCYEFVSGCDPSFIKDITSLSVIQTYFLAREGVLNYLYSSVTAFIAKLAAHLAKKNFRQLI